MKTIILSIFVLLFHFFFFSLVSSDSSRVITIHVDEELPLNTVLFTYSPTDSSTYRLFDTNRNHNSFVKFDSETGRLILQRSIDRELLCIEHICDCTKCQLKIEIIEWQQSITTYAVLKLILIINDINDNEPMFNRDVYELNIMENVPINFLLQLESASDPDLNDNSRIGYELISLNKSLSLPFELHHVEQSNTIALRVIGQLDRELVDTYLYRLTAYDYGHPRKQSSTILHIVINDINDNTAVLERQWINLNVSEDTQIGTELTRVIATDADIGLNGKIHYSITNGIPTVWIDYFRINEITGVLTLVSPLDYESEQYFRLTIQVKDLGESSMPVFCTIELNITDRNDNAPSVYITFVEQPEYGLYQNQSTIYIPENIQSRQIIAHVAVNDLDSNENGRLEWHIESDLLQTKTIDNQSFLLLIRNNVLIDREKQDYHKLILFVNDKGVPKKTIQMEYDIRITDENDNEPIFNETNCNIQLLENKTYGPLFIVNAYDIDINENSRITYKIIPPNDKYFYITFNGEVYANNTLDYTITRNYEIEIMAQDNGTPIRLNKTKQCIISIQNSNEHQPIFEKNYYKYHLTENSQVPLIIGQIRAYINHDYYEQLHYSIQSNITYLPFSIDEHGTLILVGTLDFEQIQQYNFFVHVRDNRQLTNTVPVQIDIKNVNDNCPKIHLTSDVFYINRDNSAINGNNSEQLGQIQIEDADNDTAILKILNSQQSPVQLIQLSHNQYSIHTIDKSKLVEGLYLIEINVFDGHDTQIERCDLTVKIMIICGTNRTNKTVALLLGKQELLKIQQQKRTLSTSSTTIRRYYYYIIAFLCFIIVISFSTILMAICLRTIISNVQSRRYNCKRKTIEYQQQQQQQRLYDIYMGDDGSSDGGTGGSSNNTGKKDDSLLHERQMLVSGDDTSFESDSTNERTKHTLSSNVNAGETLLRPCFGDRSIRIRNSYPLPYFSMKNILENGILASTTCKPRDSGYESIDVDSSLPLQQQQPEHQIHHTKGLLIGRDFNKYHTSNRLDLTVNTTHSKYHIIGIPSVSSSMSTASTTNERPSPLQQHSSINNLHYFKETEMQTFRKPTVRLAEEEKVDV